MRGRSGFSEAGSGEQGAEKFCALRQTNILHAPDQHGLRVFGLLEALSHCLNCDGGFTLVEVDQVVSPSDITSREIIRSHFGKGRAAGFVPLFPIGEQCRRRNPTVPADTIKGDFTRLQQLYQIGAGYIQNIRRLLRRQRGTDGHQGDGPPGGELFKDMHECLRHRRGEVEAFGFASAMRYGNLC